MATSEDSQQIPASAVAEAPPPARHAAANPAALTVEQLARAMGMPAETVRRHVEDGAPAGADGRINLIHYAAWLNKRLVAAEPEAKTDGD